MLLDTGPAPPPARSRDADAGVIKDARRRQRLQQTVRLFAILVMVGVGLVVGFGGGSGGDTGGGGHGASQEAPGQGGAGAHQSNAAFPGAPVSQNFDGVASWQCPVARANRYLPARSGCVTVIRADMTGDRRADLVIVYSHLSHTSGYFPGGPSKFKRYFGANDATLEVVLPDGKRLTTPVESTYKGRSYPVHVAAIIAVRHVNNDPGDELFLEVSRISSGATAVGYGYKNGRLIPAGVLLAYEGDSGVQAGFNCLPGHPARVIQRIYVPDGNLRTAPWQETDTNYVWRGAALIKTAERTYKRPPLSRSHELNVGAGCGPVNGPNTAPPD